MQQNKSQNTVNERIAPRASVDAAKKQESPELKTAMSSTAADVMNPTIESADLGGRIESVTEGSEFVSEGPSERVGEAVSEHKAASAQQSKQGAQARTAAQIKSQLLQSVPAEVQMKKEIKKEIKREIRWLRTRSLMISFGIKSGNAFELNNIVKKIRELKDLLRKLASATVEMLKNYWLRFVHGVH